MSIFGSRLLPILFILGLSLSSAHAECEWKWDCSGGQCRQVPLCDNSIDLPPVRPPEVAPIAPPSIEPINLPTVPPVGTSKCHMANICDGSGDCHWQQVCQ
ncbi:hypothetical protein [Swingsia samuiensis]|uniref:Uncharacterized protein n=1 Tax=Swingsia samuiensis TaxID=1293412 RepID=A0A4Y6UIM5_9PROT|nr:hypothetical protein [Swingsia samuiensis]QDH17402.1 hypothetical protein E3D00_07365 [Swingsia samuiensis]